MWIKICGVNEIDKAREIARLGPDAIGLNFYERSVRQVSPETARRIAEDLPPNVLGIGVFVEATADAVREVTTRCRLGGVQLHAGGAEDAFGDLADCAAGLAPQPMRIRAFHVGERGLAPVAEYVKRHQGRSLAADAFLIDAQVDGQYGGTGKTVSWQLLRNEYQTEEWPRLILAGGLCPENVGEAIDTVRPWGVDVASGVESSPGVKDLVRVARFIQEARRAFAKQNADGKAHGALTE